MARINWKTWPVVEVDVVGAGNRHDLDATLGALAGGLERGAPFAVIVALDEAAARELAYGDGGGFDARELPWLRSARGALRDRCRGIGYVMSSELLAGHTRALSAARTAFACPAESFGSAAAARAWAHGRLAGTTAVAASPGVRPRVRA